MINKIHYQNSIVENYFQHDHVEELKVIDEIIFQKPQILQLVHKDLIENVEYVKKGRKAILSAEQVLKILLIKQMNGFSYERLRFHLADSRSYRTFCKFSFAKKYFPSKSTLQRYVTKIKPETLEKINRLMLEYAKELKIENGRKARVDCTVVESNIHKPSDSKLLWDCIRTICRIGKRLGKNAASKLQIIAGWEKRFGNRFLDAEERKKGKSYIANFAKQPEKSLMMRRRHWKIFIMKRKMKNRLPTGW
jgi:IS5 family transposase